MARRYTILSALMLTMLCSARAFGQSPECDLQTATVISKDRDWGDLYSSFKHAPCDSGVVARAYTQLVVNSLTKQWADLTALQQLAAADSTFLRFVLKHVDGAAEKEDLELVQRNASSHCPKALPPLCALIAEAAKGALHQ